MVRNHYKHLDVELTPEDRQTTERTYELSEFLVSVLGVTELGARFPHKVAMHQSCHGLRELGLGRMSEREGGEASPAAKLLGNVKELVLQKLERTDECCGFGGTFAVAEAKLSVRMGQDRMADFEKSGAEFVTGGDMSCLMHLDGVRARQGHGPKAIHLAEILACR
jgi:L-lactate dehydrogenase complex protein LldE